MKWPWSYSGQGIIIALLGVLTLFSPLTEAVSHSKVLLKDVQTITLHQGRMTTGRRTSPVRQLKCVGGNACGDYEPDVVQCTNTGFDGSDVQWKCQADMPSNLRFGRLNVYCEGYAYPDDPYVLKGSCGLEYNLFYTDVHYNQDKSWDNPYRYQSTKAPRQSWSDLIYYVLFAIAGIVFFVTCCSGQRGVRRDDPPPPYRAHRRDSDGYDGPDGWGSGWGGNNNYRRKPNDGQGFRPGFWSGVAAGGLATHLATNRTRQEPSYSHTSRSSPSSSRSSRWGESSSSSDTYTATGYGETSRR
ncbi:MAG: hypothetical protein J3Q66DRAFT_317794 [Benniella sp.]|nr:MAG: hypothetical protein J3Q66DRAFT_317794 [Benniella sp.]